MSAEKPDKDHKPTCDPPDVCDEITDVLKKLRKERNKSLFVLATQFVNEEIFDEVYNWRKELKENGKALDILIDSPGGDLSACYMVARLFSRCTDAWEALVPTLAASGATLICLGSSNIVMSEMGQLSPLDPQVISKRREKFFETERQSPLEAFQAVRYLREFSLASLDAAMMFLRQHHVAAHPALETASKIALRFVEPILAKIEPYDLGAFALDSSLAVDYCKRIGDPPNKSKRTQRLVNYRALVETYPAHEFFIDVDEASELNFVVSEATAEVDKLFDDLRFHLEKIHRYIGLVP